MCLHIVGSCMRQTQVRTYYHGCHPARAERTQFNVHNAFSNVVPRSTRVSQEFKKLEFSSTFTTPLLTLFHVRPAFPKNSRRIEFSSTFTTPFLTLFHVQPAFPKEFKKAWIQFDVHNAFPNVVPRSARVFQSIQEGLNSVQRSQRIF